MSSSAAAYLNAVFWGSFALGRLLSIPISAYVPPQLMLMVNTVRTEGIVRLICVYIFFVAYVGRIFVKHHSLAHLPQVSGSVVHRHSIDWSILKQRLSIKHILGRDLHQYHA